MQSLSDERVKELLKIKEGMLEQVSGLAFSEAMGVLGDVAAVLLSAIEDSQPTEAQRKAVVPLYLETLKTAMDAIRMIETKFGNQARGEAVPTKSKLN